MFVKIVLVLFTWSISLSVCSSKPENWPWYGGNLNFDSPNSIPQYVGFWADRGATALQIKLKPRDYAAKHRVTEQVALEESLKWADKVLDECRKYGLVGIVTFVQYPINPKLKYDQYSSYFWSNPKDQLLAIEKIKLIVNHFKSRGSELAAYDFFNEPLVRTGNLKPYSPSSWYGFQLDIVEAVRSIDPERYIVANAGYGGEASAYKEFSPLKFNNIIYGVHIYNPHSFTHQGLAHRKKNKQWPFDVNGVLWDKTRLSLEIEPYIDFLERYGLVGWVGEFSSVTWEPTSDKWLCDLLSILSRHENISWSYWGFSGHDAWNVFGSNYSGHNDEENSRLSLITKILKHGSCHEFD